MIVLQIPLEAIPDAFDFDDPQEPGTHAWLSTTSRKGPPSRFADRFDRGNLFCPCFLPVPQIQEHKWAEAESGNEPSN